MIIKIIRTILLIPQPAISKNEAIEIAKQACIEKNWSWIEPIHFEEGLKEYRIRTNVKVKGGNAFFWIDCQSGKVRRSGFSLR